MELTKYFLPQCKFFLNNISYRMIESTKESEIYKLKVTDNVETGLHENGEDVRILFSRSLNFEPRGVFELTVSFGCYLKFNMEKKDEIDWETIELAKEFSENGSFVMDNLVSRAALQIAQITASYGSAPIVTPPKIVE